MSRCVVIAGASASGKTTLAKFLELEGFRRIVTYTTRPKRKMEVDGIDYHFVTEPRFQELKEDGIFAETSELFWSYGSAKRDYHSGDDTVIILDPKGVSSLEPGAFVVWLDIPFKELENRLLARGEYPYGIIKRLTADKKEFEILRKKRLYNMRITGVMPVEKLAKKIIAELDSRNVHLL